MQDLDQQQNYKTRDSKCRRKRKKKRPRSRPDLWSGVALESPSSPHWLVFRPPSKQRAVSDLEWVQNHLESSSHHSSSVHGQLRIYFTREQDSQRRGEKKRSGQTKIDAIDPHCQPAQFRQANPHKMRNSKHYVERALERGAPVSLTASTRCWEVKLSPVGNTRVTVWRKSNSQVQNFDALQSKRKAKRRAYEKSLTEENAWDTAVVASWSAKHGEGVILPEDAFITDSFSRTDIHRDAQSIIRKQIEGTTDLAIGQTVRFKWAGRRVERLRVQRLGGFRNVPEGVTRIVNDIF